MTMLFAFTSPSHDTTFLGSDDLNSLDGKRTDKVRYVVGRYLVGVIGSGMAFDAVAWNSIYEIENTRFRDGTPLQTLANTDDLIERLEVFLSRYAVEARKDSEHFMTTREIPNDRQEEHRSVHSKLLICDAKEYSMHLVDFGNPFDPNNTFKASIQILDSETAYRVSDGAEGLGPVDAQMARNPEAWCDQELKVANDLLVAQHQPGILGELGACAFFRAGIQQFRTSFDSIEDYFRIHKGLD
jgi:hypothetical protein